MKSASGCVPARACALSARAATSTLLMARTIGARTGRSSWATSTRLRRRSFGAVDEIEHDVGFVERGERGARASSPGARYRGLSRPGVSSRIICTSSVVLMPTMRSRVDCGLGLTMLSFSADDAIEERGFLRRSVCRRR